MRVDTMRVKAESYLDRSRRCCRSKQCCPHNIYTLEALQDNQEDTLEEVSMASALKWIIKNVRANDIENMVSMLMI